MKREFAALTCVVIFRLHRFRTLVWKPGWILDCFTFGSQYPPSQSSAIGTILQFHALRVNTLNAANAIPGNILFSTVTEDHGAYS